MAVQLLPFTQNLEDEWDQFVWKSNNGTLFHTRKFLSYHPEDRFQDHSLYFKDGNRIIALFPAALRLVEGKRILSSHCGASYGGFVYQDDLSIVTAFDLVKHLIHHTGEAGIDCIEMTFPPDIYQKQPNNYLDFALYKHGFHFKKREISSIIPLSFTVDEILTHFKPEARTALIASG